MKNRKLIKMSLYILTFGWILLFIWVAAEIIFKLPKILLYTIFTCSIIIVVVGSVSMNVFLDDAKYWKTREELDTLEYEVGLEKYKLSIALKLVKNAAFNRNVITEEEFNKKFDKHFKGINS